jgi:hypothetical protein
MAKGRRHRNSYEEVEAAKGSRLFALPSQLISVPTETNNIRLSSTAHTIVQIFAEKVKAKSSLSQVK